ncbi:MinD/ParA family ATP-binding protein [Mumia qirimensis]|uniref:MinD/ParA family ATP-binding protein n=1 Tax=Mumia qirimensis TaxID=3234852 RepID=UPI00351CF6F4
MTDDRRPPGDDNPNRRDPGRRSDAQGAAADLARMGIDPRSLGLDSPPEPGAGRRWAADPEDAPWGAADSDPGTDASRGDNVVALRPEWAAAPSPAPSPARPTPPASATLPGTVQRPPSLAEHVVAGTVSPAPAGRTSGSWVRGAARGMVTLDSASAADAERTLIGAVRRRHAGHRTVAFLSAQGGVGTTTVASGVGAVLAALRDDRTVLVDVQAGTPALSALLGVQDPHSVRRLLASSDAATPPLTPGGLAVVDGPSWDEPLGRADLGGVVDRLAAQHAFLLLDAGDDPTDGAYTTVARADRAVVVTGPGEIGLRGLEVALRRLDRVNPAAARSATVVVVCRDDAESADQARRSVAAAGVADGQVVVLGADPALRGGRPFRADQVGAQTRLALLQVAARLAETR